MKKLPTHEHYNRIQLQLQHNKNISLQMYYFSFKKKKVMALIDTLWNLFQCRPILLSTVWKTAGICYRWVNIPLISSVIYVLVSYKKRIKRSSIYLIIIKKACNSKHVWKGEEIFESVTLSNIGFFIFGGKKQRYGILQQVIDYYALSVI